MTGDRETIEDGDRYRVIHRENHPWKTPRFYVWDKEREITRREFWYPSGHDDMKESARLNALEKFEELEGGATVHGVHE